MCIRYSGKNNFAFKFVLKTTIFSGLSIFSGAAPVAIPEGGDATPTPEKDGEVVFDSFLRKKKFMSIIWFHASHFKQEAKEPAVEEVEAAPAPWEGETISWSFALKYLSFKQLLIYYLDYLNLKQLLICYLEYLSLNPHLYLLLLSLSPRKSKTPILWLFFSTSSWSVLYTVNLSHYSALLWINQHIVYQSMKLELLEYRIRRTDNS